MESAFKKHCIRAAGIALFAVMSVFTVPSFAGSSPCAADEDFVVDKIIITPAGTQYLGHCEKTNKNHKPRM